MHDDLIRRAEAWLSSPEAMTAADDLISDLLAALKAQQPAPPIPQAPLGEDFSRVLSDNLEDLYMKSERPAQDHDCALKRGAVMCRDCDLDVIEKAAPVDAEGLPPLPEPDGVSHVNIDPHPDGSCDFDEVPAWSEPLVRQAQREAQAVERERWGPVIDEALRLAVERAREILSQPGYEQPAFQKLLSFAEQAIIRQGAKT